MNTTTTTTATPNHEDGDFYDLLLQRVQANFEQLAASGDPLFHMRLEGPPLFDRFLATLPPERRQHYTCHACRRFFERYGAVAAIGDDGVARSIWPLDVPSLFTRAMVELGAAVAFADVDTVFLTAAEVWGEPVTGPWHHVAIRPPKSVLAPLATLLNFEQQMAAKREEHGMLARGLAELGKADNLRVAVRLLESDALYRSEKCLGVAKWLLELRIKLDATKNTRHRDRLVWRAVAKAPPGWCHVRTTTIGTLLEDIAAGLSYDEVARRFADKMHPLQYQRPTAAPSAGQIDAAEKVIAQLKSAGALERRFASLGDLQALWTPRAQPKVEGGVFGHLRNQDRHADKLFVSKAKPITWEKFARDVLPGAERIEYMVAGGLNPYCSLVTAANPDAPPVLQWDRPERRNPVSWYLYTYGSTPESFNMAPGGYAEVTAVVLAPHMWDVERSYDNHEQFAVLLLKGCRDLKYAGGAGLFPETLRSEYHAIRHVIEAHMRTQRIEGAEGADGFGIRVGGRSKAIVKVLQDKVWSLYEIDRWD